jgi:hypothetical protein
LPVLQDPLPWLAVRTHQLETSIEDMQTKKNMLYAISNAWSRLLYVPVH